MSKKGKENKILGRNKLSKIKFLFFFLPREALGYIKNKNSLHFSISESFLLSKQFLVGYFYQRAKRATRFLSETKGSYQRALRATRFLSEAKGSYLSREFLKQSYAYLPLIVLAFFVIIGNFQERTAAASFFEERIYQQNEIENFVVSISPYTPILEEEPSLTAEILGFEGGSTETSAFLEKPELSTTLSSSFESQPQVKKEPRKEVTTYTVSSGETLSSIAKKFDLSVTSLASSNNLTSVHQIKTGQTLSIPPANGIIHTVSKGETLSYLVKKYQGDLEKTLKYNPENIQIGQKVVIVGGKASEPPKPAKLASSRNVTTRENRGETRGRILGAGGNRINGYPWGWCTWYAAYRRNIPRQWGNAGRWLSSARAAGYATSSEPRPGAIIATKERWPLGHVGYVESVSGGMVTISEMNYKGFGVISQRTISKNHPLILGYIY